ncbi:hypothetical protein Bbelb_101410 [Branchiostoma belcheri]|nr:hypothetical protein Bbelb_101410 [Branchiostoma belcheri]
MTRTKCQVSSLGPGTQSNTDPGGFDVQPLDRHKVTSYYIQSLVRVIDRFFVVKLQNSKSHSRQPVSVHVACDKRLTGDNGTFTSPNYPNNYPNYKDCRYEISVTPPKVVRLTFTDFNIEDPYDVLLVYDGNTTDDTWEIERLNGANIPSPITSSESIMTVLFHADNRGNRKGFQANYAAVDKVLSTCEVGQFLCADGVTCIKAWKRCDGNRDCRDGSDEDTSKCACQNIPRSLRLCRGLEYNKMTVPNPLNSDHTTVNDIMNSNRFNAYRDLVESGCHPRIKDYVCAIIVPRCNSSPKPRQQLPCRSWCEEVQYSCRHEPAWSIFPPCKIFHYNNCNNVRPSRTRAGVKLVTWLLRSVTSTLGQRYLVDDVGPRRGSLGQSTKEDQSDWSKALVECFDGNGANYRGNEARGPIGEVDCSRWDADTYPKTYPWANLVDNKCRNPTPARDRRPWCFTSSGFEYCDIIPCNISIKGCEDPGKPLYGKRSPVLKFYWPNDKITYTCNTGFKFPKGSPPNTARCVQVNESTGEVNWATTKPNCQGRSSPNTVPHFFLLLPLKRSSPAVVSVTGCVYVKIGRQTVVDCDGFDHKYKLQEDLLSETVYNKEVAPTTSLYFKAYVKNVINLDEKAEQIVTSYKAEWSWMDDRLAWNRERYGKFDHMFVRAERVWLPTLTLETNADTRYSGTFPFTEVRIDNDGEVNWPIAALATTTCTLDPFLFPQDNMTCAICFTVGEDYTIELLTFFTRPGRACWTWVVVFV